MTPLPESYKAKGKLRIVKCSCGNEFATKMKIPKCSACFNYLNEWCGLISYYQLEKPEKAEGLMKLICPKCHKVRYVKFVVSCECVKWNDTYIWFAIRWATSSLTILYWLDRHCHLYWNYRSCSFWNLEAQTKKEGQEKKPVKFLK